MLIELADSYNFQAPIQKVWDYFLAPESIDRLLSSAENVEQISSNTFWGEIDLSLPLVGGIYQVEIQILEQDEPTYCKFMGRIDGPAGLVTGHVQFDLQDQGARTLLRYSGIGDISKAPFGMSKGMIENFAKSFIDQGLEKIEQQLQDMSNSANV